jgi:hypothetical protein
VLGLDFAASDLPLEMIEGDPTTEEFRERVRELLWAQKVALRAEEGKVDRALRALNSGEPLAQVRRVRGEPRRAHPVEELKRALGPMFGSLANRLEASTFESDSFTTDQIDAIEEFLREHNPDAAERFTAQREIGTSLFTDLLDRHGQQILRLADEKQRDPELFAARLESASLDRRIRRAAFVAVNAQSERAEPAMEELRALTGQQFDLRLQIEMLETDRLSGAIEERRRSLETRSENRDRLVDERVKEILEFTRTRAERFRDRLKDGGRDRRERGEGGRGREDRRG